MNYHEFMTTFHKFSWQVAKIVAIIFLLINYSQWHFTAYLCKKNQFTHRCLHSTVGDDYAIEAINDYIYHNLLKLVLILINDDIFQDKIYEK